MKVSIEQSTLTALADAVRSTTGAEGLLTPAEMTVGVDNTITLALDGINIVSQPLRTSYNAGDEFDTRGLAVNAIYRKVNTGDLFSIPVAGWSIEPNVVEEDTESVDVVYQEKGTTKSASIGIDIVPIVEYAGWGDETVEGDAQWWADLRNWVKNVSTPQERKLLVGKKKWVRFSETTQGNIGMSFICIGADNDGDKTLTFHSEFTFYNQFKFGSNNVWDTSSARSTCEKIADNMTAVVDYITPVTKITRNHGELDETVCRVWLPSVCEYGCTLPKSNDEWTKEGNRTPYLYFTDDYKREMWRGNTTGKTTAVNGTTADVRWTRSPEDGDYGMYCITKYGSDGRRSTGIMASSSDVIYLVAAFTI